MRCMRYGAGWSGDVIDATRKDYPHYGGHGIRVCQQWRGSDKPNEWNYSGFEEFEKWAMAHGFKPGMTLDRINNNLGYRPDNTRWVSKKAQAYNRRTNRYLTYQGRTQTLTQWSKELDIPDYTICKRLAKGWSVEKTLSTPRKRFTLLSIPGSSA